MNETIRNLMRDVFDFIRDHADVPSAASDESTAWWMRTAQDMCDLSNKYDNHPLLMEELLGVFRWLEQKQKNA